MARTENSAAQKPVAAKGQSAVSAMKYRPLDGHGLYDATVVRENPNGTVDIVVEIPGCAEGLALNRIRVDGGAPAPGRCCKEKGPPRRAAQVTQGGKRLGGDNGIATACRVTYP